MSRDTYGSRLAAVMEAKGVSRADLAKAIGRSVQAIGQVINGSTRALTSENHEKAVAFLGCSGVWLTSGEGEMFPAVVAPTTELVAQFMPEGAVRVPVLANAASMGGGADVLDEDAVCGRLTLTPQFVSERLRPVRPDALRFIHGYGDSMAPTFNSGDVLLVDTDARDVKIDGIYVLEAHGRLFVKRVRQRLDGSYEISSDNPTHKTVDTLNGDHQVEVKGRVVWAWNGRKL